jgi:F420-0:gamma-glutamyl ligase
MASNPKVATTVVTVAETAVVAAAEIVVATAALTTATDFNFIHTNSTL